MQITMECTEEQAELICWALEDFFRLRMRQNLYCADSLAKDVFKYDKTDPDNEKKFDAYIQRREYLEYAFRTVMDIAYGYSCENSDTCRNASDIWSALRHELYMTDRKIDKSAYDVRERTPIQLGTIRLPKIKIEREENE